MKFINVGPVHIREWAGKVRGFGGWWQNLYMHPQRTNILLQRLDRHALTVGAISGPTAKLEPYFSAISPVVDLNGWQKAFTKTRPVDTSQWGSEHA